MNDGFKIKDIRFLVSDCKKILNDEPSEIRSYWYDLINDILLSKTFEDVVTIISRKNRLSLNFLLITVEPFKTVIP